MDLQHGITAHRLLVKHANRYATHKYHACGRSVYAKHVQNTAMIDKRKTKFDLTVR